MAPTKALLDIDQGLIQARLQAISTFYSTAKVAQIHLSQAHFHELKDLEQDFKKFQADAITYNASAEDKGYDVTKITLSFYDTVRACKSKHFALQEERSPTLETSMNISQTRSTDSVRMERVAIKVFNGDLDHWSEFYETYTTLIHDSPDFTDMEKFIRLKRSLTGDAWDAISSIHLSKENYQEAYKTLVETYESKRLHASHHLSNLLHFKSEGRFSYQVFVKCHKNNVKSLKNLNMPDLENFLFFELTYRNLRFKDRHEFDVENKSEIPTYEELISFLEQRAKSEKVGEKAQAYNNLGSNSNGNNNNNSRRRNPTGNNNSTNSNNYICTFCGYNNHPTEKCKRLLNIEVDDRHGALKEKGICVKCLGVHEGSCENNKGGCTVCNRQSHHTILHTGKSYVKKESDDGTQVSGESKNSDGKRPPLFSKKNDGKTQESNEFNKKTNLVANVNDPSLKLKLVKGMLLGTVVCYVKGLNGQVFKLRALLDPCSQLNLITESCFHKLGLKLNPYRSTVQGVGNNCTESIGITNIKLHNRDPDQDGSKLNFHFDVQCKVVDFITEATPTVNLPEKIYQDVKNLRLADPEFHLRGPVDLLLNVGAYCKLQIAKPQSPAFIQGTPSRIYTKWGWVILGELPDDALINENSVLMINNSLENEMLRFLGCEEIQNGASGREPEDLQIEKFFKETTRRDETGRYIVALPFRDQQVNLPSNRERAFHNFLALEKKLAKNNDLSIQYHDFMQEYINLGHMELAQQAVNYVHPQHLIINENRSSTKLRVVFDASSKINGQSLNQNLLVGPKLQNDLSLILMAFRLHKYTLIADVKKMYRQIRIREEDQKFQHVFYRKKPNEPLRQYTLLTLTYGQTPAPYLSLRVMQELRMTYEAELPLAAYSLKNHSYIDDVATGADSTERVLTLKDELIKLLGKGQFELSKFASNNPKILESIAASEKQPIVSFDKDVQGLKVLGLMYDPEKDFFHYKFAEFSGKITKREVLRYIAGIYDYLGYLAPITFSLKLFMQDLWLEKIAWDDAPSDQFAEDWSTYMSFLSQLPLISLPRLIPNQNCFLYFVAFSDASKKGMCTVVYLMTEEKGTGKCHSSILMCKTRIAPLKNELSIPKLELQAAVMSVDLVNHIRQADFWPRINKVFYFTDSEIVLHWLRMDPNRLKTFVANRVSKIKQETKKYGATTWNYCNTLENPADLGTRKFFPKKIIDNALWFNGPDILKKPPEEWNLRKPELTTELPEVKKLKPKFVMLTHEKINNDLYERVILRHSSFSKVVSVMGYVLRFINALKKKRERMISLSVTERQKATDALIKLSQQKYFADEIDKVQKLKTKKDKPKKYEFPKRINHLTPFVDDDGILRAEGRLIHAKLSDDSKYPVILDKNCHLSRLLCRYYHIITCHSGLRMVQAAIAKKYNILGSRPLIKNLIRACPTCVRWSVQPPKQPLMGNLPGERVNEEYAFENTFFDFAGPFNCKDRHKYRPIVTKGYLMVAVSLAIKAVHLEFVSELTTVAFLDAFGRFAARRGYPKNVFTDNGSNFKGGQRELTEVAAFLEENKEEIFSQLASREVNWHFQPPYAPNMNGLVEAAVKSAKSLMKKQIGDSSLTYEEFNSLFCRIESILNSRPLVLQTASGDEPDYLCPNNFLMLKTPVALPTCDPEKNQILRDKFARIIQNYRSFWNRWSREYLHTLMSRQKWVKSVENPKIGDIVYLKDMNTSPLAWPLGRVTALYPGQDGQVRVVDVKTQGGQYTRPVNRLVFLEILD